LVDSALVKAHGVLFTHGSVSEYTLLMGQFLSVLDNPIGHRTVKLRLQSPEIASILCAATFDFGSPEAFLSQAFRDRNGETERYAAMYRLVKGEEVPPLGYLETMRIMQAYWGATCRSDHFVRAGSGQDSTAKDATFADSYDVAAYACQALGMTTAVVAQRIGDKDVLPYMHVILAYLFGLAFVPNALTYVEGHIPWESIAAFLNTLGHTGVAEFEGIEFPQRVSGTGRQLPEDFIMRGLVWAQNYFPRDFFNGQVVDEDERNLELPSHLAAREERCLWLGAQLASVSHQQVRHGPVSNLCYS
jgi:hypothetical protein